MKSPQLLVSLINSAARLPVKILTSSAILSTKERPHSMLLDLLLYSDFLEGCHKHGDTATVSLYCDTFSRLLEAALHPGSDISALAPVLDKLELAVANLSVSGLGVANTLWRLVADTAANLYTAWAGLGRDQDRRSMVAAFKGTMRKYERRLSNRQER